MQRESLVKQYLFNEENGFIYAFTSNLIPHFFSSLTPVSEEKVTRFLKTLNFEGEDKSYFVHFLYNKKTSVFSAVGQEMNIEIPHFSNCEKITDISSKNMKKMMENDPNISVEYIFPNYFSDGETFVIFDTNINIFNNFLYSIT